MSVVKELIENDPDPMKWLEINEHDIEAELASCPAFYYMFSALALDAEKLFNDSKITLEQHELVLSTKFRKEYPSQVKSDKLMESDIKRMFRGDEIWLLLKKENNKNEIEYKKLEKAAKAFEMKSDDCRSLSSRQKTEKGM